MLATRRGGIAAAGGLGEGELAPTTAGVPDGGEEAAIGGRATGYGAAGGGGRERWMSVEEGGVGKERAGEQGKEAGVGPSVKETVGLAARGERHPSTSGGGGPTKTAGNFKPSAPTR